MRLRQLRIENLRAFERLELDLDGGWNVFVGPNGAGKTTLLEAAFLLSHAKSFRAGAHDVLVRRGTAGYSVYGQFERGSSSALGLGLARGPDGLEARMNGAAIAVAELLRHAAVVCFEPGSHELISGPADTRRRFLDWGVFHVEHDFLPTWRAFQRALKQRNALLRSGDRAVDLDPWDHELARSGTQLAIMRRRYMDHFESVSVATLRDLLPDLGDPRISLARGWPEDVELADQLAISRDDDLRRGFTTRGPHRADWSISFDASPRREHLSRGQEKLCALGCVLAQARAFADERGEWPVICIDDLASELDEPHQMGLVRTLQQADAQVLITGTHRPSPITAMEPPVRVFHVEPGQVARLL